MRDALATSTRGHSLQAVISKVRFSMREQQRFIENKMSRDVQTRQMVLTPYECCRFTSSPRRPVELGILLYADMPLIYDRRTQLTLCPTESLDRLRYFFYFASQNGSECHANRVNTSLRRGDLGEGEAYQAMKITGLGCSQDNESCVASAMSRRWSPPPYAFFFASGPILQVKKRLARPLLLIVNKLDWKEFETTFEIGKPGDALANAPKKLKLPRTGENASWDDLDRVGNFIGPAALDQLLESLYSRYTILYYRFSASRTTGQDKDDIKNRYYAETLKDKVMLRTKYPAIGFVEDFTRGRTMAMHNLFLLSIASICRRFITVQGGNSILFAYFGGTHIVQGGYGAGSFNGFRHLELLSRHAGHTKRLDRRASAKVAVRHARTNRELIQFAQELL